MSQMTLRNKTPSSTNISTGSAFRLLLMANRGYISLFVPLDSQQIHLKEIKSNEPRKRAMYCYVFLSPSALIFGMKKWFPCIFPPCYCPPPLYLLKLPRLIASRSSSISRVQRKGWFKEHPLCAPGQAKTTEMARAHSTLLIIPRVVDWTMGLWDPGRDVWVPSAPLGQHWYNDWYPLSLLGFACLG